MPIIEPLFNIPKSIPFIGGPWGPFINTNLRKAEQKQLFVLFIVSLLLIFAFGSWAYYSNKNYIETNPGSKEPEPSPNIDSYNVSEFLGFDKLIDFNALMVGMGSGIVFGLIDNGGLWFGMDALDPLFEPSTVPWVYGYGGKREYSGLVNDDSVYYGVKFKDGTLDRGEKIGSRTPEEISRKIQNDYDRVRKKINNSDKDRKEKIKQRESITTNEAAFADPNSPLFLGTNMTKVDFFKYMVGYKVNEDTYNYRIENYRDYLNNRNLPKTNKEAERKGILTRAQKLQKLKYKKELARLERARLMNLGFPTQKYKDKVSRLKMEIRNRRVWPGSNKKLAQSWMGGWSPGKLTQAGIGNTYSDFLGAFLSTFVGVLILNMSSISNVSLLSEVIGIVVGCLLGIVLPRFISPKS
jgi:hypothetical protein